MDKEIHNDPLKAALIISIWGFAGFCSILLFMVVLEVFTNPGEFIRMLPFFLIVIGFTLLYGTAGIGLLEAALLGGMGYLIFRFIFSPNITKGQFKARVIIASIISALIGLLSFSPADRIIRESGREKEHIWEIDTAGDKKPDKWVHDNIYGKTIQVDYDSNLDGKPDIWEYYKKNKLIKKEFDTDFDGKPDKTENFK